MPEWVMVDLQEVEKVTWNVGQVQQRIGEIPKPFLNGVQNPHEIDAFDPNLLLQAFDRVQIAGGHVLDYIYAFDGYGGEPFPYSRRLDEPPLTSFDEYSERYSWKGPDMLLGDEPTPESSRPYLQHLSFTDDAAGYYQFAYFVMVARRFYLAWHSNYNERTFLASKFAIDSVMSEKAGWVQQEDLDELDKVDPSPAVALAKDDGIVRLFNYGDDNGFTTLKVEVRRPNELVRLEDEVVVEPRVRRLF